MTKPKLTIKRVGISGEIVVHDDNNHLVAHFRVMTPNCHQPGFDEKPNADAGLNLSLAEFVVDEIQKTWDSPFYQRYLQDPNP